MFAGFCLRQIYLISTFFALTHALPFVTTSDELCDIGRCECIEDFVDCYLKDCNDNGLHFSGFFNSDGASLVNTCDIEVLTKHSTNFVPIANEKNERYIKKSQLTMKNCLRTPASWRLQQLNYSVQLQLNRNVKAFSKSHRLWEVSTTDAVHNGWLQVQLALDLDVIRYLELTIACTSTEVVLPLATFHNLQALEELILHVGRQAKYVRAIGLRNLTAAHFRDLEQLKRLELGDNRMRTIDETVLMPLLSLEQLNLSWNALGGLPVALFANQQQLTTLDLSGNSLKLLPLGLFNRTVSLQVLNLSHNSFYVPTNMIESMHALFKLHKLDLSYNNFETLHGSGVYANTTLLAGPHVYANQLRPLALNRTINLSHNRINQLNLDWVEQVQECCYSYDLSHNNIVHIPLLTAPLRYPAHCPRKWSLAHNPLKCDCQLAWMIKNEYQFDITDWLCAAPTRRLNNHQSRAHVRAEVCSWMPNWCPKECACNYKTAELIVDCSDAKLVELPALPRPEQVGLQSTVLRLNHNQLYQLPTSMTFGYTNVTYLNAAHNRLHTLQVSHLPPNLTVLDVRANNLEYLSDDFIRIYLNESITLKQLYLSENPWRCDCTAAQLLYIVQAHSARIPDATELLCANLSNVTLSSVNFEQICTLRAKRSTLLSILLSIAVLTIMLISAITLFYKYNLEIKIWLYAHHIFWRSIEMHELDKHKTFDAFISYAHQQQNYVNKTLLPGLESGVPPFRICTHERNWLVGAYIPEQIVESVEQSRRTIIVLSQHFIESDWSRMEFRTAHQCALNEGNARIIIIKYGELTNLDRLDKELHAYLKLNTYLEWNDPRFWQKLRYVMPHMSSERRRAGMLDVPGSVKSNRNEKLCFS